MDRQQLLRRIDGAWAELAESYAGLSDSQMMEPGVQGRWSVRDIIAHVTTWEQEALTHLPHILEGTRPPLYSTTHGGIDAFNAQMTERKRDLTFADVIRQRDEVHRRLIAYVSSTPQKEFARDTRFRRRLRLDTYGHYPKHARAIRAWRERSKPMLASTVVLLLAMLAAAVLPATAQQSSPAADTARAELRTTLRAFYFSLAHQDWEALSAHILPAKVVAHRPAPEDIVAASARHHPPPCATPSSASLDDAVITLRDDWAEASVTRCGANPVRADEFRFIHFGGRWWIVFIDLVREAAVIEVAQ